MYEKKYISIKGEKYRYEEIDEDVFRQNYLKDDSEVKKQTWSEINFFSVIAGGKDLCKRYHQYYEDIKDVSFEGKVIIRPYKSLFEAVADGISGCFDVGMIASGISFEEGYLFAVKVPKAENKAFAYVLYDANGNIIKARQAFNLDIINPSLLKYLNLFAKDVLIPSLNQRGEKTA